MLAYEIQWTVFKKTYLDHTSIKFISNRDKNLGQAS